MAHRTSLFSTRYSHLAWNVSIMDYFPRRLIQTPPAQSECEIEDEALVGYLELWLNLGDAC